MLFVCNLMSDLMKYVFAFIVYLLFTIENGTISDNFERKQTEMKPQK